MIDIQDEVEGRLPFLPDVTARITLRIIEDSITTAKHRLWRSLPGEGNTGSNRFIVGIDIARGTDSIPSGDQLLTGDRIKVGPVVVCFRERRVDLIVKPYVQRYRLCYKPVL